MVRKSDYGQLPRLLQRLEDELRRLGWWEDHPPDPRALASRQPFHADRLRFEQWLQWVLLPRLQALLDQGAPLPGPSAMAAMGEVAWRTHPERVAELLALLQRIDACFNQATACEP